MNNVIFEKLRFNAPGVYVYKLREFNANNLNWTSDKKIYRIVIVVMQDKNKNLNAKILYPDGKPVFVNTYFKNIVTTVQKNSAGPYPKMMQSACTKSCAFCRTGCVLKYLKSQYWFVASSQAKA